MANIKFFIRSTNKDSLAIVHIGISLGRGKQFYLDSGFKVLTDAWSNTVQGIKPRYNYSDVYTQKMGAQLTSNLLELKKFITTKIAEDVPGNLTSDGIKALVTSFHHPKRAYRNRTGQKKSDVSGPETLMQFIERYTQEIESGKRLNRDKMRYSKYTIKNYQGFLVQFRLYCEVQKYQYDFEDINLQFYDAFVSHFTNKGYSINTIGRHVKELKIIMRTAYEEGLTDNKAVENRRFRVLTTEVEKISLSVKELEKIAKLYIPEDAVRLRESRDLFLIGCATAQRYGDYSRIGPSMVKKLDSGEKYLDMVQNKTGVRVLVPLTPQCEEILKKYHNRSPKVTNDELNIDIKEIGRRAGINEPVTIHNIQRGEKVATVFPKYELISSHTARRTGITNMVLAGVPIEQCMAVSGHKSRAQFERYVKISVQTMLMKLVNNPYFKTGSGGNPVISSDVLFNQFKLFLASITTNQPMQP